MLQKYGTIRHCISVSIHPSITGRHTITGVMWPHRSAACWTVESRPPAPGLTWESYCTFITPRYLLLSSRTSNFKRPEKCSLSWKKNYFCYLQRHLFLLLLVTITWCVSAWYTDILHSEKSLVNIMYFIEIKLYQTKWNSSFKYVILSDNLLFFWSYVLLKHV